MQKSKFSFKFRRHMKNYYPKDKIDYNVIEKRSKLPEKKIKSLMKFPRDYFDGKRQYGYGGYYYNKKYFRKLVRHFIKFYKLKPKDKILDIGCAKGFTLFEFKHLMPSLDIYGVDISKYAIKNAKKEVKQNLKCLNCTKLPYEDNYFDFVFSLSTIHNLSVPAIKQALTEMIRVSKKKYFLYVKAFHNLKQKKDMTNWNIVSKTCLSEKDWITILQNKNYNGDIEWSKF